MYIFKIYESCYFSFPENKMLIFKKKNIEFSFELLVPILSLKHFETIQTLFLTNTQSRNPCTNLYKLSLKMLTFFKMFSIFEYKKEKQNNIDSRYQYPPHANFCSFHYCRSNFILIMFKMTIQVNNFASLRYILKLPFKFLLIQMDLVTLTFSQTVNYLNLFDLMIIKWNICIHYNQNIQTHPVTKKNNSLYILL